MIPTDQEISSLIGLCPDDPLPTSVRSEFMYGYHHYLKHPMQEEDSDYVRLARRRAGIQSVMRMVNP